MLRLHSRCTPDVIGGYIGGKMIQSLQCTQDVPTGFQDTLPPVKLPGPITFLYTGDARLLLSIANWLRLFWSSDGPTE